MGGRVQIYLGTILTNQQCIQEENNSKPKSENACCYSVRNILFSSLLSKVTKIKINGTTVLPAVLYGCETWSVTLKGERRMMMF